MDIKMLCSFLLFDIEKGSDYRVGNLFISHNKDILEKDFIDSEMQAEMGFARLVPLITESGCYGYARLKIDQPDTDEQTIKLAHKLIFNAVHQLNGFFTILWFIKDCSCHLDELLAVMAGTGGMIVPANERLHSAAGIMEVTTFTREELLRAESISKKLTEITHASVSKAKNVSTITYNDKSRIERAMMFLTYARRTSFLPLKIAFYIPILESLFSSDPSELTHKVSERCALYIGGTSEQKNNNYSLVSNVYSLRSKFLHGQPLNQKGESAKGNHIKYESQISICIDIDNLTRQILTKAIMEDSERFLEQDMSKFYRELIFN